MFRKLTKKKDKSSRKSQETAGAAVPYGEPEVSNGSASLDVSSFRGHPLRPPSSSGGKTPRSPAVGCYIPSLSGDEHDPATLAQLIAGIEAGDLEGVRAAIKSRKVDINALDQSGRTPLHRAVEVGRSKVVRYLLLHGADIDAKDARGMNPLFVAVDQGNTGAVGVLLDYMHSVDNRTREAFVLLRARRPKNNSYQVEFVKKAVEIKPFLKRKMDLLQILICHGQRAEDLAVFLYSVLDVSVTHSFFLNTIGAMNMKNFQRFESKAQSHSVTVLNCLVKTMEASGYKNLRSLILISCDLTSLSLVGLDQLELLDIRYNKLAALPDTIHKCPLLKTIKCSHNRIKTLPRELAYLSNSLLALDCSFNFLKRLTSQIIKCQELRYLQCDNNQIIDLPVDLGRLVNLEEIVINNNKIGKLPLSVSSLPNLRRICFHTNPLQNIPVDFPERAAGVQEYLRSLQEDPVANNTARLVLVGQEGVGKTTLLKALKRTFWVLPHSPTTTKTDGIEIKDIQLDEISLRCFDCGGDVDFNETHNFFITQGALYLACFNLSEYCLSTVERNSFLLGRLQLWLQYIFSKIPSAQVVIVGTHADHPALNKRLFLQIWEQLKTMLVTAREHHRSFFKGRDRLRDCLLCQADSQCLRKTGGADSAGFVNHGFDDATSLGEDSSLGDTTPSVVSFPHIFGYYEVGSLKSTGNESILQVNQNLSIQHLKNAIKELGKKIIASNPQIPRKWSNVMLSIHNHIEMNPQNSVSTIQEVADIAKAQGVVSKGELLNMLHFFRAQGHVLFFPHLDSLDDMVILDPEWLAKIFASVVSYKDTGIGEDGFIDREKLKSMWKDVEPETREQILQLLRHFGICLPVQDSSLELFPCKLPLGEPDDAIWPKAPPKGTRQITYSVTFASMIPPPFFGNLMVAIYRMHHHLTKAPPKYYSNQIMDVVKLDLIGCWNCQQKPDVAANVDEALLIHQVLIELIPHRRTIYITTRGFMPCCVMRKLGRVVNKVVQSFEGLGSIEFDTVLCPGCFMQRSLDPHKFSLKYLATEVKKGHPVHCANAHIMPNSQAILCGIVNESCMPHATIRPKSSRDKLDFSGCPKLFILLPVNKDGMSFDENCKLFVSSLLFDGYAGHLLCEFPDGYHLTSSPGYRTKNPDEFMQLYGSHVIGVLHLLRHIAGSSVSRHGSHTKAVSQTIDDLLKDYLARFKGLKDQTGKLDPEAIHDFISTSAKLVNRDSLRRAFHTADKPDSFGPLRRLKYGDSHLWLCSDHFRQLRMLTIGSMEAVAEVESAA